MIYFTIPVYVDSIVSIFKWQLLARNLSFRYFPILKIAHGCRGLKIAHTLLWINSAPAGLPFLDRHLITPHIRWVKRLFCDSLY